MSLNIRLTRVIKPNPQILDYVREIELGNLSKAEEVIRRSVSEIFNRVYSNIKNIVSKYTLVEKCI